jgi:heme A synthase
VLSLLNTHATLVGCTTPSACYNVRAMVTKRQLGIAVIAFSALVIIGIIAVDLFGAGQWGGFGPLQRIGVGLGVSAIAVGGILVRLGDRPA